MSHTHIHKSQRSFGLTLRTTAAGGCECYRTVLTAYQSEKVTDINEYSLKKRLTYVRNKDFY